MFDLINPSTDGTNTTTVTSYPNAYPPTPYRPFASTSSAPFLFQIPNPLDDQSQRLTEFSTYPNPTQEFM
jgi:hypothetical protein